MKEKTFELNEKKMPYFPVTVATEVDVPELIGRYVVYLTYDPERKCYIVTLSNFEKCVETRKIEGCGDLFKELGLAKPDAQAVEQIVNEKLLPELRKMLNR